MSTETAQAGDTVTRPDGRTYRSRKVIAYAVNDEDASEHVELYEGGRVVRRTVIALGWEEPGA